MEQYKCGNCGNDTYKIYKANESIVTVCTKCNTKSRVEVYAKLTVNFMGNQEGVMCTGWGK